MRRHCDRDAPRSRWIPNPARRQGNVPSDTVSTHLIHPPGVAALHQWGLLEPSHGDWMPTHPHLHVRLRRGDPCRVTSFRRRSGHVQPAANRPGQAARRGRKRKREPKSAKDSASTTCCREDGRVVGSAAETEVAGQPPSGHELSSGQTAGTRSSPGRSGRSSTTRRPAGGLLTYWSGLPMDGRIRDVRGPNRGSPHGRRTTT